MKIRMKAQILGTRNGVHWPKPGEPVELPEREAAKLCKAGLAEPVTKEPETATPPKPEVSTEPEPEKAVVTDEEQRPKRGRPPGSKNRAKSEDVSDGD